MHAIVAWLLVEVASVVPPTFGAPDWVMKVFTFLVILGFPLALSILRKAEELFLRAIEIDPAYSTFWPPRARTNRPCSC